MKLSRIFPLATVLVLGPYSPVLAGPIAWNYSTTISSTSDPSINQSWVRDGGSGAGGSWLLWVDYASQQQPTGESGSASSIPLGAGFPRFHNAATDSPKTLDPNFRVTVALTDVASGQSGSVSFTGFFTAPDNALDLIDPVSIHYTSPVERSIALGGNRYDVTFRIPPNLGETFVADVGVSATPEPTTLCLVGAGVCAMFGLRRGTRFAKCFG